MDEFERRLKKEPEEFSEEEKTFSFGARAKRRIAKETARVYNSLLDILLAIRTPKEKEKEINQLINSLPGPLKRLYGQGLKKLQEELKKNHLLLEQHRGNKVRYLIETVISFRKEMVEGIEEIFQRMSKARLIEPTPGIAILEVEKDFFSFLN